MEEEKKGCVFIGHSLGRPSSVGLMRYVLSLTPLLSGTGMESGWEETFMGKADHPVLVCLCQTQGTSLSLETPPDVPTLSLSVM